MVSYHQLPSGKLPLVTDGILADNASMHVFTKGAVVLVGENLLV